MDNMIKIAPGIYLVRTLAGFRKAIRAEFSDYCENWVMNDVQGWPTSYPAVVSLSLGYRGSSFVACNSVHVNILKAAISEA
ncbi:hypothetical protein KVP10_08650 [Candidimonas humi]|uniref:Uncharacterized protein n=1 Tax=Candidimonas humi TaxID=683355 RepID=A0ABV8NXJ3_9BURK|nr:hypothetical protein [Candidimonas humi]MBV6304956.1 hypothetical protein [Candidimonas humi]